MRFDLNIIHKNVFGYVGLPFPDGEVDLDPLAGLDNAFTDRPTSADLLGRPIPMPVSLDGTTMPNAIISLTGKKTVVETPLTGSQLRGTVKELVSVDDYGIRIQGVIVNTENEKYPEQQVRELRRICEARETVTIVSPISKLFGIDKMVITDFALPEIRGLHFQPYEINGISDEDFTAELLFE